jgi:hypothetical protein
MRICGVSIPDVLRQLRTNARVTAVTLPKRFTVSRSDAAAYRHWEDEIREYQELSRRRLKGKKKARRAKVETTAMLRAAKEPA